MTTATSPPNSGLHGVMAEYSTAQQLLDAAGEAHRAGFRAMDAYTPFPIEALSEVICDHHRSKVPLICLTGGIVGALAGWGLQIWTSAVDYPMNIGGKSDTALPALVPATGTPEPGGGSWCGWRRSCARGPQPIRAMARSAAPEAWMSRAFMCG